jgi:pimeloyl-ACP methyl ester carboxylesterase
VTGNPVLLVHGFASSFELNWRQPGWVDLLKEAGREVIGVDLLGHGTNAKPHDPEVYANLEGDVTSALPATGVVDAVGFSLGARLVLSVATQSPERFERIVVGGVGANLFRSADPEPVARAIESGATGSGEAANVARLFAQFADGSGNDPAALAACLRRPEHPLIAEDLAAVSCPVLVVLGDRDFAGPAEPLVDALPDARLVTLRGVDHFATPRSYGFIDAALDFLGAVPA